MAALKRIKQPAFLKKWLSNKKIRLGLWTSLFFLAMLILLAIHFVPEKTTLEVGKVCPNDVIADRYVTYLDEKATTKLQEEALKDFEDIYKIDLSQYNDITIEEITNYFAQIESINSSAGDTSGDNQPEDEAGAEEAQQQILANKAASLKDSLELDLTEEEWLSVAQLDTQTLNRLQDQAVSIASGVMSLGVIADNLQLAEDTILNNVQTSNLRGIQKKLVSQVLSHVHYQATHVYDKEATEAKKAEILDTVEPVLRYIQQGQLIIGKGEIITETQMADLNQLGYTNDVSPEIIILGLAILIGLLIYIGRLYLMNFAQEVYRDERQLVLLMLLVFVTVLTYKLILSITLSPVTALAEQVGYLIPVAMGTMLIAVLLDAKLAIMVNIFFAAFVGLYTGGIPFMIVALVSGMVGVVGVSHLTQRSDLSKTALLIGMANTIAIISMGLLNNQPWNVILTGVVFGIFNGLFSSILTLGILPFLENMFGITTSIKLLELANPNLPLLKKLLLEAPGTYHHSIMVGNLGEAAAEAIGANGLTVRVGAYYHDIGKTKRPYFFSENQFSEDNPHDKISPTLSTLILTSHVKDGVEMAQEAKMPKVIVDMIAQHHGDTLVSYFYHKAKEGGEEVREEDFRYDQSKPQTKEAAILMMADTVEAAVRSMKNATPGQIEGFIRSLIKGKLNDGQFDECDLTFKDLDKIAAAFVRVTNGVYHKRIEYPDQASMMKQKQGKKVK